MVKPDSTHSIPKFKPCQIVCLEHNTTCLYAEAIQVIPTHQKCWVRPLLLAHAIPCATTHKIYDLRQTADIVWPIVLFRPALDTEAISLLAQLDHLVANGEEIQTAQQQLHTFLQQVWQAWKVES